MSREIKFRAWDNRRREMFFPSSVSWKDGIMWCCDVLGSNRYETVIENSELMQYTGLKDKNGKEIYEGDILKVFEIAISETENQKAIRGADVVQHDYIGQVQWDNEGADYELICPGLSDGVTIGFSRHQQTLEVIGNLYENPDLVKKT